MRLKLLTESYRVEDGESWLKLVARVSAWCNHIIIMISIAKMNTINRTNWFFCDSVNATSSAGCRWIALVVAG